ncbi:MAG: hypothetical protein GSR87_01745 [Desulfurococcales archaeon]|nr:hypothetical protein [Desulfurococcales archaeon]
MKGNTRNETDPEEILAKVLKCSIWLEERTAELYFKISNRLDDQYTAHLLKIIAHQSKSHAEMLRWIMNNTLKNQQAEPSVPCIKMTGEVGETTVKAIEYVERREKLTLRDLNKIIGKLEFIEKGVGEETYSRILLPLIKTTLEQTGPQQATLEIAKRMIQTIIREEELHENLVKTIKQRTSEYDARANPSS